MKLNYRRLGDYIQELKVRNTEQKAEQLLGINIDKFFMPSVANVVGTDMSVYKIVKENQFACNRMHVGRDYRLPISMSKTDKEFMVSPAYDVFEIKDTEILNPEFLMMWFTRREFDRNAWFYTDADVRGGLPWKSFCEMIIPIPHPDKQRAIVKEYNVIQNRIALNQQLIQKLEETAQAIYREWFVEGIDLENLPEGWRAGVVKDLCNYSTKKISTEKLTSDKYISTENMLAERGGVISGFNLPNASNVTCFETGNILISNIRPYFKKIWIANYSGGCSNDVLCLIPNEKLPSQYLYQILEKDSFFEYVMAGSKGTKMPRGDKKWIMDYPAIIPDKIIMDRFSKVVNILHNDISFSKLENQKLTELKELLLARMAKMGKI